MTGQEVSELDLCAHSICYWGKEVFDDPSLSFRFELANKLRRIPTAVLKMFVEGFQAVQKEYFAHFGKFYPFLRTAESRVFWSIYTVQGEGLFKKFRFWNDYQFEWISFNQEEDKNQMLDVVLAGFKMVAGSFAKLPDDIRNFQLSKIASTLPENEIQRLETEMVNFASGVKDDHDKRIEAAEQAFLNKVRNQEEELERKRESFVFPEGSTVSMLSPEDIIRKSKKR